jgi:iron complex outermembrane receptor protein
MDMIELGLRLKLSKILTFDLEAFYTTSKNYDDVTFTGQIVVIDGVSRAKVGFENMSLIAKQMGITASLNFNMSIVNLKLFGTIQKTDIENYNDSFLMNPNNEDLQTLEHKNTPRFYGGAYLNIKATKDLNININPYYYTSQVFIHSLGTVDIRSKFILNAKIEYKFSKELSVYFNGRNILNDKSREFGYADEIGGLYLVGLNINY